MKEEMQQAVKEEGPGAKMSSGTEEDTNSQDEGQQLCTCLPFLSDWLSKSAKHEDNLLVEL